MYSLKEMKQTIGSSQYRELEEIVEQYGDDGIDGSTTYTNLMRIAFDAFMLGKAYPDETA